LDFLVRDDAMPTAVDQITAAPIPKKSAPPAPASDPEQSEGFAKALRAARRKDDSGGQPVKPNGKAKGPAKKGKAQLPPSGKSKRGGTTESAEPQADVEPEVGPVESATEDQAPVEPESNVDHVRPEREQSDEIPPENLAACSQASLPVETAALTKTNEAGNEDVTATGAVRQRTSKPTAATIDVSSANEAAGAGDSDAAQDAVPQVAGRAPDATGRQPASTDAGENGKREANKPIVRPLAGAESPPVERPPGKEDSDSIKQPVGATEALQNARATNVPDAESSPPEPARASDKSSHDVPTHEPTPVLDAAGTTSAFGAAMKRASVLDSAPPPPPEVQFAQVNHDRVVTGVRAQLLPQGGAMQIRLDPPELGALQVMVEMRDGTMQATFQTSNDEATRLLSHSLNQLKHVLESQGVSVERLQVQQAPKNEHSNAGEEQKQQQQGGSDEHAARQEQQRKELLRRMWRKVSGGGDPLDLVA
jgi:flagellar hook-length control protein FliK